MDEYILAIESSCDDSCICVMDMEFNIVYERKVSQIDLHKVYGGVVPELASRCHVEYLQAILSDLSSCVEVEKIKAVAATFAPGLIGGLLAGTMIAKGIAHATGAKLIGIHHLEGHLESVNIGKANHVKYPNLTLLVSGGHCQFILAREFGRYEVIGKTIDDSVGEAFDKIGKMLGFEYPGGPKIEEMARIGKRYLEIGSPMQDKSVNFSFSGFKTNVMNFITRNKNSLEDEQFVANVCMTVQKKICDNLLYKTKLAIFQAKKLADHIEDFTLCGGVAANRFIVAEMELLCSEMGLKLHFPQLKYATDNATMIAVAGVKRYKSGLYNSLDISPKSRMGVDILY